MKSTSILQFVSLAFVLSTIALDSASAQTAAPQGQEVSSQVANPPAVLSQVSASFAGPLTVHSAKLSGAVTYFAGRLKDSGTVNLNAADDGSSQMQLNLNTTGQIVENQTGKGTHAQCQWSGADQVAHKVDAGNCWRAALWFLPAFSLQPSLLTNEQVFADLGAGTVGSGDAVYRHLRGQIVPPPLSPSTVSEVSGAAFTSLVNRSTADIGLDAASGLPAVLTYTVHPDNGSPAAIAIEVRYADYHTISGVQIPFHIERYVNDSLQLDILLSSATID